LKKKEVCPKCRKKMVHIAKNIQVCPYCGKEKVIKDVK
jgi:hypothetical protein